MDGDADGDVDIEVDDDEDEDENGGQGNEDENEDEDVSGPLECSFPVQSRTQVEERSKEEQVNWIRSYILQIILQNNGCVYFSFAQGGICA